MFDVCKNIYEAVWYVLDNAIALNYFKIKQRSLNRRGVEITSPTMYPWLFLGVPTETPVEILRMPRNWTQEIRIPIVYMTFADRMEMSDLIYSTAINQNKGIGDIKRDIQQVLWQYKTGGFGVQGVRDWIFGRSGTPDVLYIQDLLMSGLVMGGQTDIVFQTSDPG